MVAPGMALRDPGLLIGRLIYVRAFGLRSGGFGEGVNPHGVVRRFGWLPRAWRCETRGC